MEREVLGAPVTQSKKDEDTIKEGHSKIRNLDVTFDEQEKL